MSARLPTCPICKQPLPTGEKRPPDAPFCSARCRVLDLGNWLGGAYALPARPDESDDLDVEAALADEARASSD